MKRRLWQIIAGAVLFAAAFIVPEENEGVRLAIFITSFVVTGGDLVLQALKNILKGQVFDENFLMSIASIGAFLIGEHPEGVAVMLFYQTGELFQSYAVDKSRRSITDLMDIRPDYANVRRGEEVLRVDPDEVKVGELIIVKAGERVPLDGKVLEGTSLLDTSALTGESVPREVEAGNDILSGCVNMNGVLVVEVIREFGESTVNRILDLVENASGRKSRSEQFITRFARYYTPIVVGVAAALAVIPPLIAPGATFRDWIYRGLSFLVVSCPCALVISIPLSFFGGIGGASRKGILVKGGNYLEALAQTDIMVFDKTGTLTKGVFNVQEIHPEPGFSEDMLLELAVLAESYSNHPISASLKRAYGKAPDDKRITDMEEISGHGVHATVDGKRVLAGNSKLVSRFSIDIPSGQPAGTVVHVAVENLYAGHIVIADEIKDDSAQAIRELKAAGIRQVVMLTGDNQAAGEKVAAELGFDKVYTGLLPTDKVSKLEELLAQKPSERKLAFVGDGINDAPVLARADIGIAMGGLGSDAAIEASDIVIMNDEPSKIVTAIRISKKTLKTATQNIVFAIGVKGLVLVLSAFRITSMWAAIFADVGVSFLAILNSFRGLNVKNL
ncbi:MAG: cadmium-translocating P-type ATPase [Ruminiclostridium sp.]|nr:cadmium-translocating P-type ATPase [Ruminiclostridium sp.]